MKHEPQSKAHPQHTWEERKTLGATPTVMRTERRFPDLEIKETTGKKTKPRNEDFKSNFS